MADTHKTLKISVLGAGVMGLSCAYALWRDGHDVTLYDPLGFPADNASFIAGGMLAPYSELDHMPQDYLPAGLESIQIWSDIQKVCARDFEFSQNGSILIAHPEDRHLQERFKSILPANDQNWEILDAQALYALEPALSKRGFKSGLYLKTEAKLAPRKAMEVLCDALPNKMIQSLNSEAAAQKADYVIDCRGMSDDTQRKDLRGVKGEVLLVQNPEFSLARPLRLMHPRYPLYIIPRADHHFLLGATIIESAENEDVSVRSGLELLSALYSLHPSFAEAKIIEMRARTRPSYADNLPRLYIQDNIIKANGLYRHGFLLAPVMAQCVLAMINKQTHKFEHLFIKGQA